MPRNGQSEVRAINLIVRTSLRVLVAVAVAIFVGLAVLPRLGWYRPITVLSGSMRPTFAPGDLIIMRPEPLRDIRVGQVITYHVPGGLHQLETHRLIKLVERGDNPVVQTQGDANNWRDPWTAKLHGSTAWYYSFKVPYAGYAIWGLRGATVRVAAIVVAPALLALLLLAQIWGVALRPPRHGRA